MCLLEAVPFAGRANFIGRLSRLLDIAFSGPGTTSGSARGGFLRLVDRAPDGS